MEQSIQNFENKKEFREVKLSTKKSFREDQAALDARLSKYRNMSDRKKSETDTDDLEDSNEHVHGQAVDSEKDILLDSGYEEIARSNAGLDNIVLDLSDEADDKERTSSTDDHVGNESVKKCDNETVNAVNNEENKSDLVTKQVCSDEKVTQNGDVNGSDSQQTNGSHKLQTTSQNGGNISNSRGNNSDHIGNVSVPNGHISHHTEHSSVLSGSKIQSNGHAVNGHRPITPEPKIKMLRGIYQKNPKLNAGSTDHLDTISLRSFRPGYVSLQ